MTQETEYLSRLRHLKVNGRYRILVDKITRAYFEVSRAYYFAIDGSKGESWSDLSSQSREAMEAFIDGYLYNRNDPQYETEYLLNAIVESLLPLIDELSFSHPPSVN